MTRAMTFPTTLLLRLCVIAALGLFATATMTFAASKRIEAGSVAKAKAAAPVERPPLVVPDVRGKPYVFAKGILDDAGFAWRVTTRNGYATNTVSSQTPAPGTRVVDTGAPLLMVSLERPNGQKETGSAENGSPFSSTPLRLVSGQRPKVASVPASPKRTRVHVKRKQRVKAKA
jgi:beta-lactam-binding protein with PASTA domain